MAGKQFLDKTGLQTLVTQILSITDAKSNIGHTHTSVDITDLSSKLNTKVDKSLLGVKNGVATLDNTGLVSESQLPKVFVNDVYEVADKASLDKLPVSSGGKSKGKIYITIDDGKTYRYGGSTYVEISKSLVLGDTDKEAFRGDLGKKAYDHITFQGNPHGITATTVGLGLVENKLDKDRSVGYATKAGTATSTAGTLTITSNGVQKGVFNGSKSIIEIPTPTFNSLVSIKTTLGDAGTEPSGIASLTGGTGKQTLTLNLTIPKGDQGIQGPKGDQGIQGPEGKTGPRGLQGPPGNDGADGAPGKQGIQGIRGPEGAPGKIGPQGATGNGISEIVQTVSTQNSGEANKFKVNYTNQTSSSEFSIYNGAKGDKGDKGAGIKSATLTQNNGSGDTSTLTLVYEDPSIKNTVISIKNGEDGKIGPPGPQGPQGPAASNIIKSVNGKTGAVSLGKADVGLGSVENETNDNRKVGYIINHDGNSLTTDNPIWFSNNTANTQQAYSSYLKFNPSAKTLSIGDAKLKYNATEGSLDIIL